MPNTNIILIRHAEKIPWPQGYQPNETVRASYIDNHILSAKGYERAQALVGYFYHRQEITRLYEDYPLTTVLAQDVDNEKGWGKSERPRETIWPLLQYTPEIKSKRIQSPLQLQLYTKFQLQELIDSINNGDYDNQTIIISWCHQQLGDIVSGLGVDFDGTWPKKRFDVTWIVEKRNKSCTFTQYPQLLMYGDKP